MRRHELLTSLHEVVRPRTYLEIGVNDGRSLALSRVPSVAIDPAFKVTSSLRAPVQLERTTSDEFFARPAPLKFLPRPVIDLAFIDGMHLSEFALRDFMNVERWTSSTSVIVLDDVLPRSVAEAHRDRKTNAWTGDVYKVVQTLRVLRPDLLVIETDTEPTGTAVVLMPDAASMVLSDNYDRLVEEMVVSDPQNVPTDVLKRRRAMAPQKLIGSGFWELLRYLRARTRRTSQQDVRAALHRANLAQPTR